MDNFTTAENQNINAQPNATCECCNNAPAVYGIYCQSCAPWRCAHTRMMWLLAGSDAKNLMASDAVESGDLTQEVGL